MPPEVLEETPAAESPPPRRFSLANKKTRVLVLLLLVMGAEGAGMYLLFPGRSGAGTNADDLDDPGSVETVEVAIDTFRAVNTIASPGVGYHVEFKLTAIVARDQEVAFQQAATKEHRARVHQAVEQVVRSANLEELNDPRLNVIRRKIKEEINKALRKSYVQQVIISGFQPIAQ